MEIIAWIGFAQSLFAALLMLAKQDKNISDRVLTGWLVLLAIEFFTCAIDFRILGYSLLSSSPLLFNPALYIYIRSLVRKNFKLKWTITLHLLPYIISEIAAYVTRIPLAFENFFENDTTLHIRLIFAIATIISWMVYLSLSIIILHKYRINLRNEQSNIDFEQNLSWLMFVSVFYVVYCLIANILGFTFAFSGVGTEAISFYNYSTLLALVYIFSFYGLRQKQIEIQTEEIKEPKEIISYKNSILTKEIREDIKMKIFAYFENEKAYLNSGLNMDLLSSAIDYPKYQITEVLNVDIGKNFFQFVNSYRIEAVKKMLLEPKLKYSIEAVGYECGFNSKSSFYTVFKANTGMTPIAFRNYHLKA
ncbi:MAG TPA: AraC family transcriptional regulator [Bacteroidales bacterium]|nr:AraC family transcriptional regulator [Bacteroidales bacterium]